MDKICVTLYKSFGVIRPCCSTITTVKPFFDMRIKTYLLTSAIGLGLAFSSANLIEPAYAQKGAYLNAQTQWAVTKVQGNGSDASKYCAVARRFEQGTILTIAQNPGDETSFALDFQKYKFDPTRALNVTLDPGAGEQRVYDVKPLSAKAFVVKLGRDDAFFHALQKTGLLRVEAANQSYVFNISDVDAGQFKLSSCLNSIRGASVPAGTSSADAAVIKDLNHRVQTLEIQNEALMAKVRAADTSNISGHDVSAMAGKLEVLRSENERLKLAIKDKDVSGKHTQILEQQIESLKNSNAALQDQLSENKPLGLEKKYADRIAAIKEENEVLKGRVQRLLDSAGSAEEAAQELASFKAKNEALNEKLAAVKSEAAAYQTAEIGRLQDENQVLKSKLADYEEMVVLVETLRERVASLESQNTALRDAAAEVDMLHGKVASLEAENATLRNSSGAVQNLQQKITQLESQNDLLKQSAVGIADDDGESVTLLKTMQEKTVAALNGTIDMLRRENKQKDAALMDLGALKGEVATLREEKEALEAKLAAASAKQSDNIEALKKELNDVQTQAGGSDMEQAELDALQKRLEQAVEDNQLLEDQLMKVRGDLKSAQTAKTLQQEYEGLVAALRQENDILKDRIDTMQGGNATASLVQRASHEVAEIDVDEPVAIPVHGNRGQMDQQALAQRLDQIRAAAGDDAFEIAQLMEEDMTEAQRQEALLRQTLEQEIIDGAIVSDEPVEMNVGEDPYEEFGVIEQPDPFAAPEEPAIEDVETVSVKDEPAPTVYEEPEVVIERIEEDEPVVAVAPILPESNLPESDLPESDLPGVENVLENAGVVAASSVERMSDISTAEFLAFQWSAGDTFGTAEQKTLKNAAAFDDEVKAYIMKTQQRCEGDFAVIPDTSKDVGDMRIDTYEIACVGAGVSSAVSLVFYQTQGVFSAIAHEIAAENMEQAMSMRDKIFTSLTGSTKS